MPHLLFSTLWRDDIWWRLSALPTHIFYSYLIMKPVGSCLHKKWNNKLVSTVMAMLFSALFWALEIALRITCHNVISQTISHCPVLCQTFKYTCNLVKFVWMGWRCVLFPGISVADPDPGSGIGCFLTPGSGIRNRFFPDPGSQIPSPYF